MIFRHELEVDVHDVDFNGIARTTALMRYIQTAAQSQLTENGMSYDRLKSMGKAFILARMTMEFTEPLRAYDKAVATSYPCESRAFTFLRCYTLEKEGKIIGKATSAWALIDTNTRSLVRVDDFDLGLTTHAPHDLELARFVIPREMDEVGKYLVGYGATDQNRHMNNTTYPDMYSSFLPLDGKRIHKISINYRSEAPTGEVLTFMRAHGESDTYYFRTVREDGTVNSEAEISLTDIV